MKNFADMSQAEIYRMSDEDFKAVSPFEKKSCYDCAHLEAAVSWWCMNESAAKVRGTRIPGCIKCNFWGPKWSLIDKKYHPEIPIIKTEVKEFKPKLSTWAKIKQYLVTGE